MVRTSDFDSENSGSSPGAAASDEYGLVANVIEVDRVVRLGAKAWIVSPCGHDRVRIIAASRSGRQVEKWIPIHRLTNFRCKWVPEHLRPWKKKSIFFMGERAAMEKSAKEWQDFSDKQRDVHPNRLSK